MNEPTTVMWLLKVNLSVRRARVCVCVCVCVCLCVLYVSATMSSAHMSADNLIAMAVNDHNL